MELEKLVADKDKHKYITSTIYQDKIKEIKLKYLERLPRVSILSTTFLTLQQLTIITAFICRTFKHTTTE